LKVVDVLANRTLWGITVEVLVLFSYSATIKFMDVAAVFSELSDFINGWHFFAECVDFRFGELVQVILMGQWLFTIIHAVAVQVIDMVVGIDILGNLSVIQFMVRLVGFLFHTLRVHFLSLQRVWSQEDDRRECC